MSINLNSEEPNGQADEYPRVTQRSDRTINLQVVLIKFVTFLGKWFFRDLTRWPQNAARKTTRRQAVRNSVAASFVIVWTIVNGAIAADHKLDSLRTPFDNEPFDGSVWRMVQTSPQKERRAQMAGGLARTLTGDMTEKQVIELLGQPDWQTDDPYGEGTRAPRVPNVKYMLQYKMGRPWMDISGDSYLLQLYFDKRRRYMMCAVEVD